MAKITARLRLVESNEKKVIVEINDVGPLKHGRVIDLNERMRYFDPTLQLGLISDVKPLFYPVRTGRLGQSVAN